MENISVNSIMENRNLDELFDITLELSEDAYDVEMDGIDDYSFLDSDKTFPILLYNSGDTLYIAFRGTGTDITTLEGIGNTISNILTDIGTTDPLGLGNYISYYDNLKGVIKSDYLDLKAHEGFLSILNKVYLDLTKEIFRLKPSKLIITGHSAGGALATLFYYLYQNDNRIDVRKSKIEKVISYGSPRVIYNIDSNIEKYNENCKELVRIYNLNDIVSYLPFNNNLIFNDNITTGFKHVGLAFCLDSNLSINSLNALAISCVRKNINNVSRLLDTTDYFSSIETMKFLYTDKYLDLMSRCFIESYNTAVTLEETTDLEIEAYTLDLKRKTELINNYNGKCDLLKPLGIEDILKRSPIGETEEQENVTIASIGGAVIGFNKISTEAHSLKSYRENMDLLINQEVEQRQDVLEETDGKTIFKPEVEVVSREDIMTKLMEKIEVEIESGKIVGIVKGETNGLIIYND